MPQVRNFKKGSIIYFDGESKNNFAFLFKSGVLTREKLSPESVQPERTRLVMGEFFGIKAALGVLPRDETIQVVADSVVYLFTPKEFEDVIKKNISIIFKMLKAFSNELRRIHHAIEGFLHADSSDSVSGDSASRLLGIGSYYFNQKAYKQAVYALGKYLQYYPDGEGAAEAQQQLDTAKEILSGGSEEPESVVAARPAPKMSGPTGSFRLLETPESFAPEVGTDAFHKAFGEFAFIYSKKEWAKADVAISKITVPLTGKFPAGPLYEKIFLARARSFFYIKKYAEATQASKDFIKNYKGSPWTMSAMAVIAECYVAQDQMDHAKAVYQKIADSEVPDLSEAAQTRLSEI